jgi:hypothetical protein
MDLSRTETVVNYGSGTVNKEKKILLPSYKSLMNRTKMSGTLPCEANSTPFRVETQTKITYIYQ